MRIRTVKPELWSSPDTAACADPWARLLFIAMWNWADDTGKGTANPKELAGFAFPNDDHIDSTSIRRMLVEVSNAYGVVLYRVGRRTYYAIPSWDQHQKIDRKSGGRHPEPSEGEPWDPESTDQPKPDGPPPRKAEFDEGSSNARRELEEGSGTGTGEQGNRGTTKDLPRATPAEPDGFADFWAAYPKKADKRAAEKAYRAAVKRKTPPAHLLAAAKRYAAVTRTTEPRFIKNPATWLNAGAYDDAHEQVAAPAVGGYEPWRNYPDQSVYDEPMFPTEEPR